LKISETFYDNAARVNEYGEASVTLTEKDWLKLGNKIRKVHELLE